VRPVEIHHVFFTFHLHFDVVVTKGACTFHMRDDTFVGVVQVIIHHHARERLEFFHFGLDESGTQLRALKVFTLDPVVFISMIGRHARADFHLELAPTALNHP